MKALKVNYIIGSGPYTGRKAQQFFNCDFETAKKNCAWLHKYEVLSTEMVDIDVNEGEYWDIDGMLKQEDPEPPTYNEEREWREFYQKTTGNPLPKGRFL